MSPWMLRLLMPLCMPSSSYRVSATFSMRSFSVHLRWRCRRQLSMVLYRIKANLFADILFLLLKYRLNILLFIFFCAVYLRSAIYLSESYYYLKIYLLVFRVLCFYLNIFMFFLYCARWLRSAMLIFVRSAMIYVLWEFLSESFLRYMPVNQV